MSRRELAASKRFESRSGWSFTWQDLDDLNPHIDASWLLEHVSRDVLRHHVESIEAGVHPGTGSRLAPLMPHGRSGRAAKAGGRPNIRGLARTDGRSLADLLQRTKIVGRSNTKIGKGRIGTGAITKIKASTGGHAKYLVNAVENHATEHLAVDGKVAAVIDKSVATWLAMAMKGPPSAMPVFGAILGRDV